MAYGGPIPLHVLRCPALVLYFTLSLSTANGLQRARLTIPTYCNIVILLMPVVTKDLPISPQFSPYAFFNPDASSALLQLVNQWLDFTYSRSHAFRYGRKNTISVFHKNRTHDFRTNRCGYQLDHSGDEG